MKKLIFAVILGAASLSGLATKAQVSVRINIGQQPSWGPTGYDYVDYYYLPDVDAYYYVPGSQYVYMENGSWVWRNNLPSRYSGYNLYNGYKVVMNTPRPYLSHQTHITQYSKYKNYKGKQPVVRDSRTNTLNTRTKTTATRGSAVANNRAVSQNTKPAQSVRSNGNGKKVETPGRNNQSKASQGRGNQASGRSGRN